MRRNILRPRQTGIPITTMWEYQNAGLYPQFFKLGKKSSGIFEDEHDRIIKVRAAGATDDQLRALVEQIHNERQDAASGILEGLG